VKRLLALVLVLAGCSDHDRNEPAAAHSGPPQKRRVIEPPVGVVRALPPHAIRATSVGPYKLGEKLAELLEQLPSGPRMALFEVPGLLHRSLIRAEDNAVLIGGEPQGTATMVAVVGSEVARTESGIHVGSTRAELIAALGQPVEELDRARDPRLLVPSGMKSARIILDGDKVSAIAILSDPPSASPPAPPAGPECPRPPSVDKAIGACLTGTGELIEVGDNEITLRTSPEKVLPPIRVPNVIYAVPLRAEGKDELVAITRTDESQLRRWSLVAFRIEAGKLVKATEPTLLYEVSAANARWIGAEVHEVDLYLELAIRGDAIEVGGLLTTRPDNGSTRDVVVISTISVPHRHGKPAGVDAASAGSGSGSAVIEPSKP
jgi:hypothetical protein